MRFRELIQGLEHLDILVFDRDALVVFQNGSLAKEDIAIELLPILKDTERMEMVNPAECQLVTQGRRIFLRRAGEFTIAVFLPEDQKMETAYLDAIRAFYRLKPELK